MVKSKKGISPLIATVLIIGFTVALAAIIMTWGTKFTRDVQKSTDESAKANVACAQDVVLNIQSVCEDDANYNIIVANDGNEDIVKFNVRLYKSSYDVVSGVIASPVSKYSVGTLITNLATSGGVKRVDLIPTIRISGSDITCSSNLISYGDVTGSEFAACGAP